MISNPAQHPRRAVTLLEVILSMGLLVVLSAMTYWFYGSMLETGRAGTSEARDLRLVRVVLDRMSAEIRQASVITSDGRPGLMGGKERIGLSTLRVPSREITRERRSREEPAPAEYDLITIEYKIARHPEVLHDDGWEYPLGLARVERRIPRPIHAREVADGGGGEEDDSAYEAPLDEEALEQMFRDEDGENDDNEVGIGPQIQWEELYAPEIRYLRFCYYDGHSWWDDWTVQGDNPLPQLVMVTVGFDPHAPCGEDFGQENEDNEEFCECLNRDPPDCEPLPDDQFTTMVRVTQADPLFRSRIARETQSLMQELGGGREGSQ